MYSQYALAKLLLDRNGEFYEPEAAVDWLKQSAERGNAVAKYRLGKLFLLGEDVPQDTDAALGWLNFASDDGYEYAQYLLGKLYAEGKYVEKDVFFARRQALPDGRGKPRHIQSGQVLFSRRRERKQLRRVYARKDLPLRKRRGEGC